MNLRSHVITIILLACSSLSFALGQAGENLAAKARASASESLLPDMTPEKGIDGDTSSRWSGIPGHNSGVWYELRWRSPVSVSEVVVRQYDRFTEQWDLESWDSVNQKWIIQKHFGGKGKRLPLVVVATIPPVITSAIRIANITNGPSFTEVEVYADSKAYPPRISMASDLQGNYIGILTDSFGSEPVIQTHVKLSGKTSRGPWQFDTQSDDHGLFTAPMVPESRGAVTVVAANGAGLALDPADFQYGLTPVSVDQKRIDLNGPWSFATDPPKGFWEASFDDGSWSTISVPSNWEMKGFHSINGVGGYRRQFEVPSGNGRLKLRFDGVYSGAEVWVNGQRVAYHEGGFTPFEVDITDVAHPGKNLLAIRVTEHTVVSDRFDHMSLYADFPLSGISRKVSLFRVPQTHIARYTTQTEFDSKTNTAWLDTGVYGIQEGGGGVTPQLEVLASLRASDGTIVTKTDRPIDLTNPISGIGQSPGRFRLKISSPRLWTAETPNLYTLTLELRQKGELLQRLNERIGLRQTKIDGSRILINGTAVKIRGTCHHDQDPLDGRAVSVDRTRQDMRLIKEANLNSVRTSHYPPIPELLAIADEVGLYVEDEASFCWADATDDLLNAPRIIQLTAELVARDRNHPSVFMWSICNESRFGVDFQFSHEWVRQNDPSRPTGAATSEWLDIATLHNPISIKRMKDTEGLDKPLLFDESWCIYQGIFDDVAEMWVDPGMRDYYAAPLPAIYRTMMDSKVTQGSQIWAWSDDLFCVPGRGIEYGRGATMSHFVDNQYAMPGRGIVGDAPWGVVDGWRREKPEFWITKKLHSPVKVPEGALSVPMIGQAIQVPIENQYDFTNLSSLKVSYAIDKEVGPVSLDVPAHSHGALSLTPKTAVRAGDVLDLRFANAAGMLIDEYRLPIGTMHESNKPLRTSNSPIIVRDVSALAGEGLEIIGSDFDLLFDKTGGYLRRCVAHGIPILLELPSLHVLPTETPLQSIPNRSTWSLKSLKWSRQGENVHLTISGRYPGFEGSYTVAISPSGDMTVHSSFTYSGTERNAREIGLSFSVPRQCDILNWVRNADWSVYPADHIGRPIGTATAFAKHDESVPPKWSWSQDNSPMGSNDFRSTKRNIQSASIANVSGIGASIRSNGQQSLRAMVDTDRIVVNVSDWFGGTNVGWGEWTTNYGTGKSIHTGDRLESTIQLNLVESCKK